MVPVFKREIAFDVTNAVRAPLTWSDPCPVTGMRRVTAHEWKTRPPSLFGQNAYWFNLREAQAGGQPWSVIEGISRRKNSQVFDLLFANGRYREVTADEPVYVRPEHYEVLKCGK